MYVMCGCLSHGDVDRALLHFRQASERGIGECHAGYGFRAMRVKGLVGRVFCVLGFLRVGFSKPVVFGYRVSRIPPLLQ